jgi:hypothetical protein
MNAATPFFRDGRSFPTRAQLDEAVSDLAELLSLDRYTLAEIAVRMQITGGSVCVILHELCQRMGAQAA